MTVVDKKLAKIEWVKLNGYNLAWSAREAGFDISVFEDYKPKVQKLVKQYTILEAIRYLKEEYEDETEDPLDEVSSGVYVIRLEQNFTVQYPKGNSPIIYIGRGQVDGRIKDHFKQKLFPLMESLSGVHFDFWIANPKRGGRGRTAEDYHKQLEYELLEEFGQRFGGDTYYYPILNKNKGTDCKFALGLNWDEPLRGDSRQNAWILTPTKHFKVGA